MPNPPPPEPPEIGSAWELHSGHGYGVVVSIERLDSTDGRYLISMALHDRTGAFIKNDWISDTIFKTRFYRANRAPSRYDLIRSGVFDDLED